MEIDDAELKSACEHLGADFEILRGKKCPYCKGETKYVDSSLVYGRSYGMMYLCEPCDAYVGVHHKTSKESFRQCCQRRASQLEEASPRGFRPHCLREEKELEQKRSLQLA